MNDKDRIDNLKRLIEELNFQMTQAKEAGLEIEIVHHPSTVGKAHRIVLVMAKRNLL